MPYFIQWQNSIVLRIKLIAGIDSGSKPLGDGCLDNGAAAAAANRLDSHQSDTCKSLNCHRHKSSNFDKTLIFLNVGVLKISGIRWGNHVPAALC